MDREALLKDLVEHDTDSLFEDGKALYHFVHDTLMHNYSTYTDEEIKELYKDIFGDDDE